MGSLLSYRNYNGTVEYFKEDRCLLRKLSEIWLEHEEENYAYIYIEEEWSQGWTGFR